MSDRDAWIIRRLLCGKAEAGDHETTSTRFRAVIKQLAETPLEGRQEVWGSCLADRDDASEIKAALVAVDPSDPMPEEDDPDAWGPIRLGQMPPAVPFPLDVLPAAAIRLAREAAASIGCPIDFIGCAMLATAAGAIGRSVSLLLKEAYFARSSLYLACVAPPSAGKTPGFRVASIGVRRISDQLAAEHRREMEAWAEVENAQPKSAKPSPPPKPRRIDIDDVTFEALVMRLSDNPRGLIMHRDELTSLLCSFNQYKGGIGADRAGYLSMWSGEPITRDRVLDPSGIPVRCAHPCLTIFGGIPPDKLGVLQDRNGAADGLIERFLFSFPDPVPIPGWSEDGIPEASTEEWCCIVARLWIRGLRDHEGMQVPNVAYFTPQARTLWQYHYDRFTDEMNDPGFPASMSGAFGKLREYAGRLTLVLACLHHAADARADPKAVPVVDAETVERAWALIDYFGAHALRAHRCIGVGSGIGGSETVKAICRWLRDGSRLAFTEHELTQARRWIRPEDLTEAIAYLTQRNVIRPIPPKPGKRGRPSLPSYEVNTALLVTQKP